ncbi:MAG: ATP-binding protein, partial [Pseudobdellovibrionaceae bacterium]|nr:ATP-binding protein [Pseudobdellovibrionaceae bacterium]
NQVILNLYSNAMDNLLDHKVPHPKLGLHMEVSDPGYVDLVVRDNGTGLSLENFQFITEEADRLPGKDGIGLKLTKRLLELYGGSLNLVESEAAQGSAFVMRLLQERGAAQGRPVFPHLSESRSVPGHPEISKVERA